MKPRTLSLCGTKGLASIRAIDWRTSSSRSEKDSIEKWGFIPTSSWIWAFSSSSEKVSIPPSVWWIRTISRVPSRRWGDRERADLVVCDHASGVADDVGVSLLEPVDLVHVEAGVHAGHDGHAPGRWQRQVTFVEGLGVRSVVPEQLVGHAN